MCRHRMRSSGCPSRTGVAEAVWRRFSTFLRDVGVTRQAVCQRVLMQELDGVVQRQPGRHTRCLHHTWVSSEYADAWLALHAEQHMSSNAHLQIICSHDDKLVRCQFNRCVCCNVIHIAVEHLSWSRSKTQYQPCLPMCRTSCIAAHVWRRMYADIDEVDRPHPRGCRPGW